MNLKELEKDLKKLSDPERAKQEQRFFKTGPGEYGEGEIFLGISMGNIRLLAKKYNDLNYSDIQKLLNDKIHTKRMVGLIILVDKFKLANKKGKENEKIKKEIYEFYLKNARAVNNWDLVDVTCPHIVGKYLLDKKETRKILYNLAKSKDLWEKRISIVSTWMFIRNNDLDDTYNLSEILLGDTHDLMHKAVGWMLREAGKKDEERLKNFIKKNYDRFPRTALRYSIERFDEVERKRFLKGEF